MANLSGTNSSNMTMGDKTQNVPVDINVIITVIINGITCPFTVLFNVLVIMAVKRRPRLHTSTNILLACLAGTDTITGLLVQPSFIGFYIFQSFGKPFDFFHPSLFLALSISSALHLMLVTCERLIAIKFPLQYHYLVTARKIKIAVIACWVFAVSCAIIRQVYIKSITLPGAALIALSLLSCIVVIVVSYVILYLETLRHREQIQTQQLPQEEVERFAKESKALKTILYVVGAVMICYLPMIVVFAARAAGARMRISPQWIRTCVMLNSLLNPLIYCWRQKEMRQFVFRIRSTAVDVDNF